MFISEIKIGRKKYDLFLEFIKNDENFSGTLRCKLCHPSSENNDYTKVIRNSTTMTQWQADCIIKALRGNKLYIDGVMKSMTSRIADMTMALEFIQGLKEDVK